MPYEHIERTTGSSRFTRSERSIIAAALLLRLLVALAVAHAKPAVWFYAQASELGELAHSVAIGNGLSSPFGGDTGPSAFLPPGYPLLIGSLFKLFGSYSHASEIAILFMQACFGTAAVIVTTLLARQALGQKCAIVTGWLLAIDPWLVSLGFVFWDTSLSLLLLLLLIYFTIGWIRHPSSSLAYATALVGALAIAVNASLALTAITLLMWAFYRQREFFSIAVIPSMLFILLCGIWPARNIAVMKAFIPLRDNLGYELWQGNRPGADGFFDPELHPNNNAREFRDFQQAGELGYMARKSSEAKTYIATNPAKFLRLSGVRIASFWLGIGRQRYGNQIFIASVSTLLGLLGLWRFSRAHGLAKAVPFAIPLICFPLPYYITHPDFRFWCLLSPILTALMVYAFVNTQTIGKTDP